MDFMKIFQDIAILVEGVFGRGNGTAKKAAAVDLAANALVIGGAAAAANNPVLAGAIGSLVQVGVDRLHKAGTIPSSTPGSATLPPTASFTPATGNPTP
jgi:thiazole synthase ThiGH ThiG subunit